MTLFSHIISDNLSGSGSVLDQVQSELTGLGTEKNVIGSEELLQAVQKLREYFPQFGLLWHFTGELAGRLHQDQTISGTDLKNIVQEYVDKWKNSREQASRNMIENIDFSGKRVLVHSNSTAIHCLFRLLSERNIFPEVWQTYSSPAGEGIIQAEIINGWGFEMHFLHEDALSNFMEQMDMVVFGADLLLEDRFVNKAGTFPISLLFNHFNKPVYVLAEQRKQISISEVPADLVKKLTNEIEKPAEELAPEQVKNIIVHNLYFEFTPMSLVNRVFLDK